MANNSTVHVPCQTVGSRVPGLDTGPGAMHLGPVFLAGEGVLRTGKPSASGSCACVAMGCGAGQSESKQGKGELLQQSGRSWRCSCHNMAVRLGEEFRTAVRPGGLR